MACNKNSLWEYLADFQGIDPMDAVVCPFVQDAGAGMGLPTFSLFVFGFVGLGLSIRVQHPGPIVVSAMLSAAVVAPQLPSPATRVMWLVLLFAISVLGVYLWRRAKAADQL